MKNIAFIILAVLSGQSFALDMTMAPDAVYIKSITGGNQISHGLALNFIQGERSDCFLRINIMDIHNSKKIRLNINQRNMQSRNNITLGLEQPAGTGYIFGSVVLNKNHLANSELEIIMYQSGGLRTFHGNAKLSNFSGCEF